MHRFVKLVVCLLTVSPAVSQQNLAENDFCGSGAERGICKKFEECDDAKEKLKAGVRPVTCGFRGSSPIVCCPLQQKKSISQLKCEEYGKSVYETMNVIGLPGTPDEYTKRCEWDAQELIVGGQAAKPKVYLHMALIGFGEEKEWLCGGSLISNRFVMSAAHCDQVDFVNATWVRLGELDLSTTTDEASPVDIRIQQRYKHPSYRKGNSYNDIVLFRLESDVKFNAFIRPICLHNSPDIQSQFKPIVTGWGRTAHKGNFSPQLMQLKVDLINGRKCKNSLKRFETNKSLIPRGVDDEIMVCAGGEEGRDSCGGDSGGPLQLPLTEPFCMFSQIGIVSFGYKCAVGEPGVYTRVSKYIPWIESIVWPSN